MISYEKPDWIPTAGYITEIWWSALARIVSLSFVLVLSYY